jgi:hypothetical protein
VTFYDGTTELGGGTLVPVGGVPTATLSRSGLSVGSHSLTAAYLGDGNHESSTSTAYTHTVQKADSSTTLTGPAGPVDFGTSAPLSVTVAAVAPGAGTPTGTVTLTDGATVLGTSPLTASGGNGVASFSVGDLLPGTHNLVATYGGDGNFNGSASTGTVAVSVTCRSNQTSTVNGNMTIGSGSTCVTAPTVTGSIFIGSGARVFLSANVYGNITSSGANTVAICGTNGNGRLTISGTTGSVLVGNSNSRNCGPTRFYGAVTIDGNHGGLTIVGNKFPSLDANNNSAPAGKSNLIAANTITGRLSCSGNVPPPTNGGQPNQAGSRSGQCASL